MKGFVGFIWTVGLAILISSTFNSILVWMKLAPSMAPYKMEAGVSDVQQNGPGDVASRGDVAIPEVRIVDEGRTIPFSADITNSSDLSKPRGEFPSAW